MKKNISILTILIFIIGCSGTCKIQEDVELQTWQDSVSYSLGSDVGTTFKVRGFQYETESFFKGFVETYGTDTSYAYGASLAANFILQKIDVTPSVFLRAFENTNTGDSLVLTISEMKKIVGEYDQQLKEKASLKAKLEAEINLKASESYLTDYKVNNANVVSLESGLLYRIISEGFGDIPTDKDRVVVHYTGKLINGTVFDSSIDRGEPSKFMVGSVIQGWQEALQLMNVGAKWELVIPSNLAYGERATGSIPANSTLVFEVELLGIE